MNEITLTRNFMDNLAKVDSDRMRDKIFDLIALLPHVPILGSTRVSKSLREKYGSDIRKIVVVPFIVLYSMDEKGDFFILALVHQRLAK